MVSCKSVLRTFCDLHEEETQVALLPFLSSGAGFGTAVMMDYNARTLEDRSSGPADRWHDLLVDPAFKINPGNTSEKADEPIAPGLKKRIPSRNILNADIDTVLRGPGYQFPENRAAFRRQPFIRV
jgi:hypothetical protein